jgi:hypothetical protein
MSETTSVSLTFICSFEGLLHVLGVAGRIADLHLALPVVATQRHDRIGWPERRLEQAVTVQSLNPLSVEHVGLGPGAAAGQLTRFDQPDLEAARFQQLEQRDPVDPGRFHGHGGDAALLEPPGDGVQVTGIGPKPPHVRG